MGTHFPFGLGKNSVHNFKAIIQPLFLESIIRCRIAMARCSSLINKHFYELSQVRMKPLRTLGRSTSHEEQRINTGDAAPYVAPLGEPLGECLRDHAACRRAASVRRVLCRRKPHEHHRGRCYHLSQRIDAGTYRRSTPNNVSVSSVRVHRRRCTRYFKVSQIQQGVCV